MSNIPEFKSNIPEHLLTDISPTDKWLMEEISKNTQVTEYLLTKREEDSKKLDEVVRQTTATNGKVAQTIKDISELRQRNKDKEESWIELDKIISIKKFINKYLINKYALICIGIFVIGCVRVFTSPEIMALLAKIIGLE